MRIQTKTTILFTVITSLFLVMLEAVVYYFINKAAQNDFNKRVELRAKISAKFRFERENTSTQGFLELQREYLEKLPKEEAFVFKAEAENYPTTEQIAHGITKKYIDDIIQANGTTVYRQVKFRHFAGLLYKDETGDFVIIKSATNQYGENLLAQLRNIMLITFIFSIILSFLIGQYFSRRSFSPFRVINSKVKQINENNLHLRLEESEGSDEIAELTKTFNAMLDRLETAFETQNNFISHASHELRTPLTTITAEADVALSKERTAFEYEESIRLISQQALKLQELIQGLLNLAKTGFDGKKLSWQKIRIDQLLYDVKENADAILPGNNVSINFKNFPENEDCMMMAGSYDLLKAGISNILLNACKYSNNNKVLLEASFEKNHAVILIKDSGIGIPADEMKYIFDPFFRASNTTHFEGYGIGMPLSKNIIRLHKGKIEVVSKENEGTSVSIQLPLFIEA